MIRAVSEDQLRAIIQRTSVPKQQRRVFMGTAAAAMLALLSGTVGCSDLFSRTTGHVSDEPPNRQRPGGPEEGTDQPDPDNKQVYSDDSPDA